MDLAGWVAIGGVVATVLATILTYVTAHRRNNGDFKTALDKRIDERVATQLETAWKRIDELEKKLQAVVTSQGHTRRVVRSWFQRLVSWDKKGRHGKLPVPSEAEMEELGILDLVIYDATGEIELLEVTEPVLSKPELSPYD